MTSWRHALVSRHFPPIWTCRFPHSWLETYGMILLSALKNLETNPHLTDRLKWTSSGVVSIQREMRIFLMVPIRSYQNGTVKYQFKKLKQISPTSLPVITKCRIQNTLHRWDNVYQYTRVLFYLNFHVRIVHPNANPVVFTKKKICAMELGPKLSWS